MAIKSVKMTNIMSHRNTLYQFPETGIINICGENSDGKSVLTKAVYRTVINPSLHIKDKRVGLITHGMESGEIEFEFYNQPGLLVHIAQEAAHTYYMDMSTKIRTYIGEKLEYVKAFVAKYNLSELNMYRSLQPLPFATTSPTENGEMLALAMRDVVVEEAVGQFRENVKEYKNQKDQVLQQKALYKARLEGLQDYDIPKEELFVENARECIKVLEAITNAPNLTRLYIPVYNEPETMNLESPCVTLLYTPKEYPKVNAISFQAPEKSLIPIPTPYERPLTVDLSLNIIKLSDSHVKEAEYNLASIKREICPMCGRRLSDGEHYKHSS